MGQTLRFRCNSCHYTADVSGGKDRGFITFKETMWCADCRRLQDVVVGRLAPASELDVLKDAEDVLEDVEAKCSSGHLHALRPWTKGEPCPNCGGSLVDSGELHELWD
jgi:hypothetical protein